MPPKKPRRPAREGSRYLSEVLADNITAFRKVRGLSQADVAERMRDLGGSTWSQAAASEVERGGRAVSIDELLMLALVLEVSPADLLDPQGADGKERRHVDMGDRFGELNVRAAHYWVRDGVRLRLDWTDEGYRPGSLVMIDQDPEHPVAMKATAQSAFDRRGEEL